MIKATSQQRGKSGGSQQQGDIRGSTLAPAATAANPSARNACQGTYPPSRRPQSVLRGSSRGEEATKKLLAIRSVQKANSPRLLGIRRIPPAGTGAARARHSARNQCCSQRPTNFPQDCPAFKTLQAVWSLLPCALLPARLSESNVSGLLR